MKRVLPTVTLILSCLVLSALTGCNLDFGEDVELSGKAFDGAMLGEVSATTGIDFPAGAEGMEYLFLGSGIDPSLAAKVRIPDAEVETFMKNTVFFTGNNALPTIQIGSGKRWWKLDGLTERVDRTMDLPKGRFLEVSCGRENGRFVVYVSWMTT